MLLTISTTHSPATDLGYLLHKNPARVHRSNQTFGEATVFYPEASPEKCTVCLMIEVDPITLVRGKGRSSGDGLAQYVNDRPYVASSFLSVALSEVFGTAMGGRSKDRPELALTPIAFEVKIPVLPSRGGDRMIRDLFEPLGYEVQLEPIPLDPQFPEWGPSRYFSVRLTGTLRLQELLSHLSVLIPVLDDSKHYWVGDDEVEKLLRRGGDWLPVHHAKEQIARRYLKHRKSLARDAIARLSPEDDLEDDGDPAVVETPRKPPGREDALEARISLNSQRIIQVCEAIKSAGAKSVMDLGCGEGRLLKEIIKQRGVERIVGMDVSMRLLEIATERLRLEQLSPDARARIKLLHGSLMYRDRRLERFDLATVIEVVEHLDAARLRAFERVLFEHARPKTILLTTPNSDFNVKFESLPAGQFRHPDHRFEWSRAEFTEWATGMGKRFGYVVSIHGIGEPDDDFGCPTQMATFELA